MESCPYAKSKYNLCLSESVDPVILEKSGLKNECKWKMGGGIEGSPHVHEK